MEKIKKYWKEILIGLLIIFSMNKCTVACNRSTKLDKQETEITQKDSVIKVQADSLNILKIRWSDAQNSQSTYQGIALGNQQELVKEITELKDENSSLVIKISNLESENLKLKRENSSLKNQLNNN